MATSQSAFAFFINSCAEEGAGRTLSPAHDLNPITAELKVKIFISAIIPAYGCCDIELVRSAVASISLGDGAAKASEISRIPIAFEHEDLARTLRIKA